MTSNPQRRRERPKSKWHEVIGMRPGLKKAVHPVERALRAGASVTNLGGGDPMALAASGILAAMEAGTRSVVDLPVEDDLDVPFTLLRWHAERPVGAAVAGVYGDEVEGLAPLGDVVRSLDPTAPGLVRYLVETVARV